jgi:hypothetical protein
MYIKQFQYLCINGDCCESLKVKPVKDSLRLFSPVTSLTMKENRCFA